MKDTDMINKYASEVPNLSSTSLIDELEKVATDLEEAAGNTTLKVASVDEHTLSTGTAFLAGMASALGLNEQDHG